MVLVSGPRQVGKTTLVKHLLGDSQTAAYFNWDIESHRKAIIRRPETFWQTTPSLTNPPSRPRVALDEIHKYPRWKRFLKGLYDAHGQSSDILVTGSGRLDVYQRGGDSLFGRYRLYHLHPFTVGELLRPDRNTVRSPSEFWNSLFGTAPPEAMEAFQTIERFTGFPEPLFSGREEKLRLWRRSHRNLVIREDLRDLTRIRDIGLIDALVTFLPERIGSPLSLNSLKEDLGVAYGTIQLWIQALSRLYYLFEIRPFSGKLARTLRRESKVYLFDFSEIENEGARFENTVALHLRKLCDAWNDWGYGDFELFYVRDKEKREVDFLLTERRKPYMLVETKISSSSVSPHLRYFHQRLNPKYSIQVNRQLEPAQTELLSGPLFLMQASRYLSCI